MTTHSRTRREWIEKPASEEMIQQLSEGLRITPLLARLLINRGIADSSSARAYLTASLDDLNSPFLLADMDKAVDRLQRGIKEKETILIYGDRDVDGITGSVLLVELLREMGNEPLLHQSRPEDGYGFLPDQLIKYREKGVTLVITVDCGIRDLPGIEEARRLGIDVIICDHHEPENGGGVPDVTAVVDPKRPDCPYPFPGLCGCAVAFKLAQALLYTQDPSYNVPTLFLTMNGTELHLLLQLNGINREYMTVNGSDETLLMAFEIIENAARLFADHPSCLETLITESYPSLKKARKDKPIENLLDEANGTIGGMGNSQTLEKLAETFNQEWRETAAAKERVERLAGFYRRLIARRNERMQNFLKRSLDLVTLATLVDVVPLMDENRGLARGGMRFIERTGRVGLRILMRLALRGAGALRTKDVTWSLGPVLNAAGRMGEVGIAQKLLMARTEVEAEPLARQLIALNHKRKLRLKENTEACFKLAKEQFSPERDNLVIVDAEGLEPGVTGIVATRLAEKYSRPAMVLIHDEAQGIAVGSCRGLGLFNWVEALESVGSLLVKYGGHAEAAGVTVEIKNIIELRRSLQEFAEKKIEREKVTPLTLDLLIDPEEIGDKLLTEIQRLEPLGPENATPLFGMLGCTLKKARRIGIEKQHLSVDLEKNGFIFKALAWNREEEPRLYSTQNVDVAFVVEQDLYRGGVQLILEDIRPAMQGI